jgi:hypothetical protein
VSPSSKCLHLLSGPGSDHRFTAKMIKMRISGKPNSSWTNKQHWTSTY